MKKSFKSFLNQLSESEITILSENSNFADFHDILNNSVVGDIFKK